MANERNEVRETRRISLLASRSREAAFAILRLRNISHRKNVKHIYILFLPSSPSLSRESISEMWTRFSTAYSTFLSILWEGIFCGFCFFVGPPSRFHKITSVFHFILKNERTI